MNLTSVEILNIYIYSLTGLFQVNLRDVFFSLCRINEQHPQDATTHWFFMALLALPLKINSARKANIGHIPITQWMGTHSFNQAENDMPGYNVY